MGDRTSTRPILLVIVLYLILEVSKDIEVLSLRNDESLLGENVLNKALGIAVLAAALRYLHLRWAAIGFKGHRIARDVLVGAALMGAALTVAYSVEYAFAVSQGTDPRLEFYITGFSLTGESVRLTGLGFIVLWLLFNLINVTMEEGTFRGLFFNLTAQRMSFWPASLVVAVLFGLWHAVVPIRAALDGTLSTASASVVVLVYMLFAALISIKWSMLRSITGALWIGLTEHFLNNTITNLVHVTTATGTDVLLVPRLLLAHALGFVVVVIWYRRTTSERSPRPGPGVGAEPGYPTRSSS